MGARKLGKKKRKKEEYIYMSVTLVPALATLLPLTDFERSKAHSPSAPGTPVSILVITLAPCSMFEPLEICIIWGV